MLGFFIALLYMLFVQYSYTNSNLDITSSPIS
jgi:hypothetical protein